MKLIIDISEDVYIRLFDNGIQDNEISVDDICEMARTLRMGTPYEERPKGEWIPKHLWDNTHIWVCSKCGNQNTHGITVEKACWKCGADMRKGGAE